MREISKWKQNEIIEIFWKLLKKLLQKQPVAQVSGINVYWERFQNETKMKLLKKYLVTDTKIPILHLNMIFIHNTVFFNWILK